MINFLKHDINKKYTLLCAKKQPIYVHFFLIQNSIHMSHKKVMFVLIEVKSRIHLLGIFFISKRKKWAKQQHYCMLRDFRSVCFKAIQGGQSFMHQSNFLCKIPQCSFFTYCRVSQFYTSSIPQQKTLLIEQKVEVEANASQNSYIKKS